MTRIEHILDALQRAAEGFLILLGILTYVVLFAVLIYALLTL